MDEACPKKVKETLPQAKGKRGMPKTTWRRTINNEMKEIDKNGRR